MRMQSSYRALCLLITCGAVDGEASEYIAAESSPTPPAYQLIDLGNANWESLPWANPPPCNLNGLDLQFIQCAGSKTLLVGAIRTTNIDNQHAAVLGLATGVPFKPIVDLGSLPGSVWSAAHGVNNNNVVVGVTGPLYPAPTSSTNAVDWTLAPGATPEFGPWLIHNLGNLMHSPYYNAAAYSVNDAGEIVGSSQVILGNGTVADRAALWVGANIFKLQNLLQNHPPVVLRGALWIDCQGDIAALGNPLAFPDAVHFYLLKRIGSARNCPLN